MLIIAFGPAYGVSEGKYVFDVAESSMLEELGRGEALVGVHLEAAADQGVEVGAEVLWYLWVITFFDFYL